MPIVESFDGSPIYYQVEGNGSPALIFVHGWSCDLSFWNDQVDHFANAHLVASLDLAGHGRSGRVDRVWDMVNFAKDVSAVQGALAVDESILVGHSSGAIVNLEAEPLIRDKVVHLVGVDAMYYPVYSATSQDQIDEFLRPYEEDFAGSVRSSVVRMLPGGVDQTLLEKISAVMSNTDRMVALQSLRSIYAWDFREALKEVQTALTCICSEDRLSRYDRQAFERLFGIRTISGVGHFLMMENPGAFNELLEDEIRRITS